MKPILFNTDMVKAILDGRKTVTRRLVKPQPRPETQVPLGYVSYINGSKKDGWHGWGLDEYGGTVSYAKPPCKVGDILYVRETFCKSQNQYFYKADNKCSGCTEDGTCLPRGIEKHVTCKLCENESGLIKWHPSLHMPKEAARMFIRVTDVRIEKLQDINGQGRHDDILKEGYPFNYIAGSPLHDFVFLWNSTIKKSDLDKYDWHANPWVWVIEFERIEKPEESL